MRGRLRYSRTFPYVIVPLIAALALLAAGAPAGAQEVGADLDLSQVDAPDPVNGGNQVQYTLTVRNNGPDFAGNTTITDTLDPAVQLESATVTSGAGGGDALAAAVGQCDLLESGQVECNVGGLEQNDVGTVEIRVTAPDVVGESTFVMNSATASSDATDPDTDDNTSIEQTTVEPSNTESDTGFIPPEGGSLTTDPGTGATPTDTTVLTMILPAGPGGVASVQEQDGCLDVSNPFSPCIGKIGDFQPPPGYDRLVAKFVYDRTIVSGDLRNNRKPWKVLYLKADGTPIELPRCNANGGVPPCVISTNRLKNAGRDLRVRVAINSDPRLATRK